LANCEETFNPNKTNNNVQRSSILPFFSKMEIWVKFVLFLMKVQKEKNYEDK